MKIDLNFYDEYLKFFDLKTNEAEIFKTKYLKSIVEEKKYIYKFYNFNSKIDLNKSKITTFKNNQIWFSPYYCFEDRSEFEINYNIDIIINKTNWKKAKIEEFIETVRQIDDLSSFSVSYNDKMWREYGNNYNGFCVRYEILNFNCFFPIIYVNKKEVDFTSILIDLFNQFKTGNFLSDSSLSFRRLSILPTVLKDKKNYEFEKELRCLYSNDFATNNSTCLQGKVFPYCKQIKEYKGSAIKLEDIGLKVEKVMIPIVCDYREDLLKICNSNNFNFEIVNNL